MRGDAAAQPVVHQLVVLPSPPPEPISQQSMLNFSKVFGKEAVMNLDSNRAKQLPYLDVRCVASMRSASVEAARATGEEWEM